MDYKLRQDNLLPLDPADSLDLSRAEFAEWERYCSVYYSQAADGFHRLAGLSVLLPEGYAPFWLKQGDRLLGGVALSDSGIRNLFTVPPFEAGPGLIKRITQVMRQMGERELPLQALDVPEGQEDAYIRAGFWPEPYRYRWMLRPTSAYTGLAEQNIICRPVEAALDSDEPRLKLEREIGLFLFKHVYGEPEKKFGIPAGIFSGIEHHEGDNPGAAACSFSAVLSNLRKYAGYSPKSALTASCLLYDAATHALIGVCLIETAEDRIPSIYVLAVHSSYRGQGLGAKMLRYVLTLLEKTGESYLRVKVMHGHPLESLCYSCGFLPGPFFNPVMTLS